MTDDEVARVLEALNGPLVGGSETYHVEPFRTYRTRKDDGKGVWVSVDVFDAGPLAGGSRYLVEARDLDGRFATGEARGSLGEALTGLHWRELDNPESIENAQ